MGGRHTDNEKQRYGASEQYDKTQDRFISKNQATIDTMKDKVFNFKTIFKQLRIREDLTPEEKLPEATLNLDEFLDDNHSPHVIWLGHSSFLIRIAGKTLLIDPVFKNAGPVFFIGQRFQESVLARKDLPTIDYVLISHDHYDHLETATVKYFAQRDTRFIVPIGVGVHLQKWGIPEDRFTEQDWWQETQVDDLLIATVPAEHYSGRRGFLSNDTLWMSFVIKSENASLYFSGDSGYGDHFFDIGQRYGPFDIAYLENGQYSYLSREVHMHPEDTIRAFKDLNAEVLVPIHWGVFSLSRHPWYEPSQRITALSKQNDITLFVPKLGEMMSSNSQYRLEDWWVPLMERQQDDR